MVGGGFPLETNFLSNFQMSQVVASATLLYTARANNGWGGGWGGHSRRPSRDQLGPVYTPGFTSLREEGARQMRQRHSGVWREGRNSSLDNSGAEIRVEQRGGETVIEFARSGEAQGELFFVIPLFTSFAECSSCVLLDLCLLAPLDALGGAAF